MKTITLAAIVAISAFAGFAQDEKNELSVWGGYSPESSTAIRALGRVPDARFGIAAVRYARAFYQNDTVKLRYTMDAIPLAVMSYPDVEFTSPPVKTTPVRPTRYAFGASPAGLQTSFRPSKKVQPFFDITGGLLYFNKTTPNVVGKRLNFTFHIGGGVEIKTDAKKAFTVGYKYFHVSNANRGISNPGFDHNLIYVGYAFSRW